ncbi:unnamed protein product [Rotaria socialis]|uniref:Uncharacterized protein n=1 Tax=Rotaria socialis TaxID=392032 RepID=A0A817WB40_9BILA|nr:unnamed protein product [Rotaria socialis]CAF3353460.1 unnamed protein product [Rotaria socialis]CAF3414230.1 unnamed protein product [Rotaria socialis]CAF4547455.1 unnamed protein product [Rotaria socialis]CAF4547751.1 unnamed protein product [Rotaria socialis]
MQSNIGAVADETSSSSFSPSSSSVKVAISKTNNTQTKVDGKQAEHWKMLRTWTYSQSIDPRRWFNLPT